MGARRLLLLLFVACAGGGAGPAQDAGAPDAPPADAAPCPDPKLFYPDTDGDGYGDPRESPISSCTPVVGRVANPSDCADSDPRAHPGQTTFFDQPVNGPTATAPFDYDCDGRETEQQPLAEPCGPPPACALSEGWADPEAPFCGQTGDWPVKCAFDPDLGCKVSVAEKRVQLCR